jgi:hypothetical protein
MRPTRLEFAGTTSLGISDNDNNDRDQYNQAAIMTAVNSAISPEGIVINEAKWCGKIVLDECLKCKEIGTQIRCTINNGHEHLLYRHQKILNRSH